MVVWIAIDHIGVKMWKRKVNKLCFTLEPVETATTKSLEAKNEYHIDTFISIKIINMRQQDSHSHKSILQEANHFLAVNVHLMGSACCFVCACHSRTNQSVMEASTNWLCGFLYNSSAIWEAKFLFRKKMLLNNVFNQLHLICVLVISLPVEILRKITNVWNPVWNLLIFQNYYY